VAPLVLVDVDSELQDDELWRLVIQAGDAGASVFLTSPFRSLPADRLTTRTFGERSGVKISPPSITGVRSVEKRLLDVTAALALSALLLLPMALTALAILITSGTPILHRQQRVGKDGRLFAMWKFRSMRNDAEAESGATFTTVDDPRRTSLGAILRRFSLDELPQLWNVLVGHMSIVGPRPERPVFVARFNDGVPWYRFRHRIRPGITGLSQVRGLRGNTPLEPRIESDNWYIEHWSLGLDLRIMARTLLAMLRGRNAH
jgi:exopolysaccharide biosynthesis polyprenyl glycosylphosphotransferase